MNEQDRDIVIRETTRPVVLFEVQDGHAIGRHPDEISAEDWASAGFSAQPVLAAVRAKCLDCSHFQSEVRKCTAVACALWPYRMGSNPFRAPMSEEQKAKARERMLKLRAEGKVG